MEHLPNYWAPLCALYFAPDKKIEGLVKFQKILAQEQKVRFMGL